MRQLYGKNAYERLKKLHWEKATEPKGLFCYFLSFTETSSIRFKTTESVMELKRRHRLETKQGVICDAQFYSSSTSHEILANLRKGVGLIIGDADSLVTRDLTILSPLKR